MLFPTGFYVYTLTDPRDGVVFYVGKGTANRAWHHEDDVRRGKVVNPAKSARIRAILDAGQTVSVAIVEAYDDEADAYEHEIELIATLPALTNIRAGGDGPIFNFTPEQIASRVAARLARIEAKRKASAAKKRMLRLTKDRRANQAIVNEYAPVLAGTRHEAEVAKWLSEVNSREIVRRVGRDRKKVVYQYP